MSVPIPRGPNHPMNSVWRARKAASGERDDNRDDAHDQQRYDREQHHAPAGFAAGREDRKAAEDGEHQKLQRLCCRIGNQ